jgi:hypothetical protein
LTEIFHDAATEDLVAIATDAARPMGAQSCRRSGTRPARPCLPPRSALHSLNVAAQRSGFAKTPRNRPQLFHSGRGSFPQIHAQESSHRRADSLAAPRARGYIKSGNDLVASRGAMPELDIDLERVISDPAYRRAVLDYLKNEAGAKLDGVAAPAPRVEPAIAEAVIAEPAPAK